MELNFVMAIIGSITGFLILMMMFAALNESINCEDLSEMGKLQCEQAKDTAWTIIAILPIALFFVLFTVFGNTSIRLPKLRRRSQSKLTKTNKNDKDLTITQKIMITMGLAKVKQN